MLFEPNQNHGGIDLNHVGGIRGNDPLMLDTLLYVLDHFRLIDYWAKELCETGSPAERLNGLFRFDGNFEDIALAFSLLVRDWKVVATLRRAIKASVCRTWGSAKTAELHYLNHKGEREAAHAERIRKLREQGR